MTSPAQRHRMRVLASRAGTASTNQYAEPGNVQRMMMARLVTDLRRLHDIQSIERKIALKAELIPEYDDYLVGVLEGDTGGEDEVVVTLMVWCLDTLQFNAGLDLAAYVLKHDLKLPERYNRDVPTLLLDEVADAVLAGRVSMDASTLGVLQVVGALTEGRDAPDQARAKLYRALGETLANLAGETPTGAQLEMARAGLQALNRAVELNQAVGAKKAIEQLTRKIKKAGADDAKT